MPSLRGIEICIVGDPDYQKLPEFPHPDSSTVSLPRPNSHRQFHIHPSQQQGNGPPAGSESHDPARLAKARPTASVYIASIPGAQFWIRYAINRNHLPIPAGLTYLFFKMFMNGRHIVSWGADTRTSPTGVAVKALYEPCVRYQGHPDDGERPSHRVAGIEARYFFFAPNCDRDTAPGSGVADDGGLVEVQVFRARHKVRKAVELEQYKNQAHYGIISPSGGLLDDPQNATFYTWCLEDARDAPYATFRFYYRSWDSLRNLNLIPDSYSKRKAELSWDSKSTDAHRDATDSLGFSFGFEPDDNSIFSDDKSSITTQDTPRTQPSQDGLTSSYLLRSPRECVQLDLASQKVPQPSKARRDAITASYLQRPLPPLPLNRPQSRSSVASRTPSITPSLLPYLDSSSVDESDAEVDVASIQTFQKSNSRGLLVESASRATLDVSPSGSASDNETSLSYTTESPSQPMLFSDNYLSTTGSILDRHIAQFTSRETEVALSLDLSASRYEPCSTNALLSAPRVGALRTEDPDWTRPTPSPVHRELAQGTAHRIRSTRPRGQPTPMPGNPWCVEKARPCCQSVTPTGHYVEPVDAYPAWI